MSRVAVVTGGTRGIGTAISKALKAADYKVAASYAGNDEAAEKFKSEAGAAVYKWDVSSYDACVAGLKQVETDLGPVNVLVNNAGITKDGMFHKMTPYNGTRSSTPTELALQYDKAGLGRDARAQIWARDLHIIGQRAKGSDGAGKLLRRQGRWDAAYNLLLRNPKRQLHARVAEMLESKFSEIVRITPSCWPITATEAADFEKAAGLLGKAGRRSAQRSALVEAAEQLRRALDLIATLPGTPALRRDEIKLQVELITPLLHVRRLRGARNQEPRSSARVS